MATGSDSEAAEDRQIWNLPSGVTSGQIAFVTDSLSCTIGAKAHALAVGADTLNPPPVHLLKVGTTRYIAFNYTRQGEWRLFVVLDSAFTKLGVMMN
jgi:hypothetical protein